MAFMLYSGGNKHTTMRETLKEGVLLENEGKWLVCCEIRGAAERPEQFDIYHDPSYEVTVRRQV